MLPTPLTRRALQHCLAPWVEAEARTEAALLVAVLLKGLSARGVHLPWVIADRVARYVYAGAGLWPAASAPRFPHALF